MARVTIYDHDRYDTNNVRPLLSITPPLLFIASRRFA